MQFRLSDVSIVDLGELLGWAVGIGVVLLTAVGAVSLAAISRKCRSRLART